MTLTTVGYGDLSPSTFPGKLIGNIKFYNENWTLLSKFFIIKFASIAHCYLNPRNTFMIDDLGGLCALGGIFILTLPIPIVVNSFASYYKNRLWRNEVAYKKRQRARKRKEMELLMRDNLLNILTVPGNWTCVES